MRFLQVMGLALVLIVLIAVVSVATPPEPESTHSAYFPRGRLRTEAEADASAEQWYSDTLAKMKYTNRPPPKGGAAAQPPLYNPPADVQGAEETYRALISYGREYLMAVRVYRAKEGAYVVANEIDFGPQGRNRTSVRQLTGDEWQDLNRALDAANFWNDQNQKISYSGDCVDWVIEGRHENRYNVVSVACPTKPELKHLAEYFPRVAGWFPY